MEDDLILKNGRKPQYYENLIFLKMEDNLNFFENESRPYFYKC